MNGTPTTLALLGYLNDLWEFDPSTTEWTWMGGSSTLPVSGGGPNGVYGTLGTPAAGNIPAGRHSPASWIDSSGNFWLFGGWGVDYKGLLGATDVLNDLWMFNPAANEWAWMAGSSNVNCTYDCTYNGVYGTLGTLAAGNAPGSRTAVSTSNWTDSKGNLWLFGGYGNDNGNSCWDSYVGGPSVLNDLWKYQLAIAGAPTFSVAAGAYTSAQTVNISDSTPDATIYYTLDGTTPTGKSNQYKKALSIAKTTTVKAIAIATGYANSVVATATYTILKPQTIAFLHPKSPVTYGVQPITLSATASSGLPVTFSVVSGPATVKSSTLTITGAGAVVVAANQPGNTIYGAAAQVTRSIAVNKTKLTVTANNLTMKKGAAVPTLTYAMTGFVNGDSQAKATTGKPALSTTATSTSPTGRYPITVQAGTLAAANYNIAFVNGTLTVTK